MKKYFKDILYGVVIIGLAVTLVFVLFNKPIKTENNVAELISLDKKPPVPYVDNSGQNHIKKEIIYVTDEQAALLYRAIIDSMTKQMDLKDKQIAGFTTVSGEATHTFIPDITHIKDSLTGVIQSNIKYNSKWFDLYGSIIPGQKMTTKFRDSVNIAFTKEPYGFLKLREKVYADAYSGNTDMKYTNIKSWQVPDTRNDKAKIGFGATVGPGIQLSKDRKVTYGLQGTVGLQLRF